MSTVKIQGNVNGTGAVTIAAPNTDSDVTVNLPATPGTLALFASLTNNGVAYVNGSGQPTSGSALTFDGTNFATTGTATGSRVLASSTSTSVIHFDTSASAYGKVGNSTSMGWEAGVQHIFNISASEGMRLTSTGLGIGTSSPGAKLEVNGNQIINFSGQSQSLITVGGGSTSAAMNLRGSPGSAYAWQISCNAFVGSALEFTRSTAVGGTTFSTPSMLLDSSGNLGLGVTPSAWGSEWKALEVGRAGSGFFSVATDSLQISNNYYHNGTYYVYAANGYAERYHMANGAHYWYTAPSGTAGNAISFTQAMTLDASGSLILGATSNNGLRARIVSASTSGNAAFTCIEGADAQQSGLFLSGYYGVFGCPTILASYNGSGAYPPLAFATGGVERMRIDASGNLLVGTTSLPSAASVAGVAVRVVDGTIGRIEFGKTFSGNTDGIPFRYNGTYVGGITYSNTNVTYSTSSDYRLKENIQPMTGALATVVALNPVTYTWKADGSAGQGFIAHELQSVVPDCVTGEKDAVDADGNPVYQGIDTSFLVATLTAAIQELKAQVDAQAAEIAALKGTV